MSWRNEAPAVEAVRGSERHIEAASADASECSPLHGEAQDSIAPPFRSIGALATAVVDNLGKRMAPPKLLAPGR
jgi:hypothetical protein